MSSTWLSCRPFSTRDRGIEPRFDAGFRKCRLSGQKIGTPTLVTRITFIYDGLVVSSGQTSQYHGFIAERARLLRELTLMIKGRFQGAPPYAEV